MSDAIGLHTVGEIILIFVLLNIIFFQFNILFAYLKVIIDLCLTGLTTGPN